MFNLSLADIEKIDFGVVTTVTALVDSMSNGLVPLVAQKWHTFLMPFLVKCGKDLLFVLLFVYANICLSIILVHLNLISKAKHCTDQFRPQLDHSDSHHCAIPNLGQMALNVACSCFSGPVWEWSPADGVGEAGKRESRTRAAEETPPAGAGWPGTGHRSQQGRDVQRLTTFPSDPPFCTLQRRLCACVMDLDEIHARPLNLCPFVFMCRRAAYGLWIS